MTFDDTLSDLLARGIAVRFRARGDSMHPAIRCGTPLQVDPVDTAAIRRGDVVLARQPRGLTAHRVVRIDGRLITTRGDNCALEDPPFPSEHLLGRITSTGSGALTRFSHRHRRLIAALCLCWRGVISFKKEKHA